MALSREDKGDVQTHLGKALANKVSKVTKDRHMHVVGQGHGVVKKPENMQRNPVLSPKSKALKGKVAKKHGYKSGEHMDKERSKPNYMPGPGSPKY